MAVSEREFMYMEQSYKSLASAIFILFAPKYFFYTLSNSLFPLYKQIKVRSVSVTMLAEFTLTHTVSEQSKHLPLLFSVKNPTYQKCASQTMLSRADISLARHLPESAAAESRQ